MSTPGTPQAPLGPIWTLGARTQPPAPAGVAPGPRGGAHEALCLAGSPTSRGVSSMILVPSLAGGDPAPSHSKGSEETSVDFARFKPFHRRFWTRKAYIIEILAKGAWVLGLEGDCVAICDGFKAIGDGRVSKGIDCRHMCVLLEPLRRRHSRSFATPPR